MNRIKVRAHGRRSRRAAAVARLDRGPNARDEFGMQLPGFRVSCFAISGTFVFLALSFLAGGVAKGMAQYGIPAETLASPHYVDAMTWVYLHMVTIGVLVGFMGYFADTVRLQRAFARLMLVEQLVYGFLDVRAADWALGTALYKGPQSLGPVMVGAVCVVLWLRLNLVAPRAAP